MCTGFWFGVLVFTLFYVSGIILFPNYLFGAFIFGCLSSGTSYILNMGVGDGGINFKIESRNKSLDEQVDEKINDNRGFIANNKK